MKKSLFLFLSLYATMSVAADSVAPASVPASPDATKVESVGQVIWAKGTVSATLPNQAKRTLTRKAEIYKEDTVGSDKSSTAQINLTDGTLLAIAENTKTQLEKYNYDKKDPSKDSYVMNIAKGGLRTITGEIGKNNPSETKTKTPIATLSTLGTTYSVIVKADGKTFISVQEGKIAAVNLKGQTTKLDNVTQKYLVVSAVDGQMTVLKNMPPEFSRINAVQIQTGTDINKPSTHTSPNTSPAKSGGGGGFCVGK